jgi:hypothetical protein
MPGDQSLNLARVAGAAVWVGVEPGQPVPPVLHEGRTDAADRHYPAHLDVGVAYPFVGRDRRILPAGTAVYEFCLDRGTRDGARARAAAVAELSIARSDRPGGDGWLWVARTDAGEVAGRLGAVVLPGLRVEQLKQLGFAHRPTTVMLLAARP